MDNNILVHTYISSCSRTYCFFFFLTYAFCVRNLIINASLPQVSISDALGLKLKKNTQIT